MNKIGYSDGISHLNNVCQFLNKHLENIAKQPILYWTTPDKLAKWSGKIDDPIAHDFITVEQLDMMVSRVAQGFKNLGIKKNDRVIVFVPMSMPMYVSMFALQKIGAIAVFLDSWARRDQLGVSAQVVEPVAMVSVEKAFYYLKDVPEIASIAMKISVGPTQGSYHAQFENLVQTPQLAVIEPVEKEHTALITFTTGSSGTPKGADRTHRFLAAQHYAINRHLPYESKDVDLPIFPIFSLNNLAAGVPTVIPAFDVGVPQANDAEVLINQMKFQQVNCATLSPYHFNLVSRFCVSHNLQLEYLKRVVTGGAPVSRDDVERMKKTAPHAQIMVLYGSTEVEPISHISAEEMLAIKESDDAEWVADGVNVGHLDEGLRYKLIQIRKDQVLIQKASDWNALEVKNGEVGELIVAGEHVCANYYANQEAFNRAKIKDDHGIIWHRTGDLARFDDKKYLWIVGRVHNAINRGGKYVFPVRAEMVMKKLNFMQTAAFLGLPDEKLGEKTVAVYSLRTGENRDKSYYQQEIKRVLDKNTIVVDEIIYQDEIPLDSRHHSKVEYEILRNRLLRTI